jgi:hypothetical protein
MTQDELPIIILCERCGSEGFIEHGHPNAPDAEWVEPCLCCAGTGREEVEGELITLEDAEFLAGGER